MYRKYNEPTQTNSVKHTSKGPRKLIQHSTAPFATEVVARRPTTPLQPSQMPETATNVVLPIQATLPIQPALPLNATHTTMQPKRPSTASSIRSIVSQRKARTVANVFKSGPELQPKYVPILKKSKDGLGFANALRAARNTSNGGRKSRSSGRKTTKRSFVPVVAMVRPQRNGMSGFRGLHFKS